MDARFLGFDNIAATLGLNTAKNLQAWYNEYLEGRETMGLNIDGFEWADPQLDFTYEFLEADGRIKAMATYVAPDSEPLARGKDVSLAKLTGTIPRQKRKIVRGENDYRRELIALQEADVKARFRGDSPVDSVRNYLANNLFDTLAEIPDSHNASVTYQVGQMTSKRKLVLTADNNQGGIIGAEFSSNVPEENVTREEWYTVGADGAITYVEGTNPIMAIKKKVRAIKRDLYNGYPMVKAKMSAFTFDALIEHPETLRALGYALRPELYASAKNDADALKVGTNAFYSNSHEYMVDFFKRAIDVDELVIDNTIVGVDKLNTSTKKFEQKKALIRSAVDYVNTKHGGEYVHLVLKDQYYNMREMVEPHPAIIEKAMEAMEQAGVQPIVKPIRGGTDGSRLSYMGLPCPNLFTGGMNFHGKFEYISLDSMYRSVQTLVNLVKLWAE